jgi:hypothetical protein
MFDFCRHFFVFQQEKNEAVHPSIIPKPSQTQNKDHGAITTTTNTTTTDADDKTEHIIMTAMKYLVH